MNKLLLGLTVSLISLGGASSVASAETDCVISNTGPGSTNTCEVKETYTCEVENENDIKIYNSNGQEAGSGNAETDGNTSSGDARSGSASNNNGTTFDVSITNEGCVVTAVSQPPVVTPPAPVTPSVGGKGEVVTPVAAPAGKGAVAALPNTSAQSTAGIAASLIGLLAATLIGSRLAVGAYSNIKS